MRHLLEPGLRGGEDAGGEIRGQEGIARRHLRKPPRIEEKPADPQRIIGDERLAPGEGCERAEIVIQRGCGVIGGAELGRALGGKAGNQPVKRIVWPVLGTSGSERSARIFHTMWRRPSGRRRMKARLAACISSIAQVM